MKLKAQKYLEALNLIAPGICFALALIPAFFHDYPGAIIGMLIAIFLRLGNVCTPTR